MKTPSRIVIATAILLSGVSLAAAAGMSQPVAMTAVMLVCAVTATTSLHFAARAARRDPIADA